ncbi:mannose-6-phosphate isomerase, class I [Ignavibacteria bacterium]|nr:class I mannose-6-phosphate isomerase [Bacteroidota bacterium]
MNDICEPLVFADSLHEKVWGGTALAAHYGKSASLNVRIGESFEIFGGNKICGGNFDGKTLQTVVNKVPEAMLGRILSGDYPLLVKLLDAHEWLSVQTHPNDALASELEGQPRGKTECWFIFDAESDAQIVYGFRDGVGESDVRIALAAGTMQDVLNFIPVKAGDFIPVPAGTVHAIGPGIVLYELQQTSDITYRLFDWNRAGLDGTPRELHIEKALRCSDFSRNTFSRKNERVANEVLFMNEYFSLEYLEINGEYLFTSEPRERLLTIVRGTAEFICGNGDNRLRLGQGQSVFVPACLDSGRLTSNVVATALIARRV